MTSTSTLFRSLLIYSICLPLAIFLGYLLATPLDISTFLGVGLIIFVLLLPVLLRWHHLLLIGLWNTSAVLFFLPGRPTIALLMCWLSLIIGFVQYILNRRQKYISVPAISFPLLFLALVFAVTALLTGGIGLNSLGSDVAGGRRYILILSAILGYFALCKRQINRREATLAVALFFLLPITSAFGDLAFLGGGPFNFIFLIFPVTHEGLSAMLGATPTVAEGGMVRMSQVSPASLACFGFFLARYGIRGVFSVRHPLRLVVFVFVIIGGLFGGFRGTLITLLLTFGTVFWLEGLVRSRLMPAVILAAVFGGAVLLGTLEHMPLTIQRCFAFLPVKIDPFVKESAQVTSEWRLRMWKDVLPQVPHYLLLGKGYALNLAEIEMASLAGSRTGEDYLGAELAGDYHNGPLTVVMPFGIWGVIGFLWLMGSGLKVTYQNYAHGDPAYKTVNRYIFAALLCKFIYFLFVFGNLYTDLTSFIGLIGLSVSLNGGVARKLATVTVPVARKTLVFRGVRRALPAT